MAIPKKIQNYLDKNNIRYEVIPHRKVYTAYDLAETLHEDLKQIAKTLLVRAGKNYFLVVVPANCNIDFTKVKKALKAKKVDIVSERIMQKILKIKPGAIAPFGKLYGPEVLLDKKFTAMKSMIAGAGSFTESIKLKTKDFVKLESPIISPIGKAKKFKPKKKVSKKKTTRKKTTKPKKKPKKK